MIKYNYDTKFREKLKKAREKEKEANKKEKNKDNNDIFYIEIILIVFSAIAIGFTCIALYHIRDSNKVGLYLKFGFITFIYALLLVYLKSFIVKILFMYKGSMMKLYYKKHNSKINGSNITGHVYVPVTDNGRLIGFLESMLYAIGILIQSYTFIGIVLAIRSYVSVSSHNNKEESEFYIIGLMGSLLSTIVITGMYVLAIYWVSGVNILTEISKYIPSIT